jgi:hypothetical protein
MTTSIIRFAFFCGLGTALAAVAIGIYVTTFEQPGAMTWTTFGWPQLNSALVGLAVGLVIGLWWHFVVVLTVDRRLGLVTGIMVALSVCLCIGVAIRITRLTFDFGGRPIWTWLSG